MNARFLRHFRYCKEEGWAGKASFDSHQRANEAKMIAEINYFGNSAIESITDRDYDKKLRIRQLTDDQIASLGTLFKKLPAEECKRLVISYCAVTWEGGRWFISGNDDSPESAIASFGKLPASFVDEAYQTCLLVNPKLRQTPTN